MSKPDSNLKNLQDLIDKHLTDMSNEDPTNEQYATYVHQLDVLYKLKEIDAKAKITKRLFSADALVAVTANLAGIAMIVGHERANVITSKALQMLGKLR